MAISKVVLNGNTVLDLTQDTINETAAASGASFHKANGERSVGQSTLVHGVIREYEVEAGENVSEGDFVEFIVRWGNGEIGNLGGTSPSACLVDEGKVFVIGSNYATIMSVQSDKIVCGEFFQSPFQNREVYVERVSENKVLILDIYRAWICVATVSGNKISFSDIFMQLNETGYLIDSGLCVLEDNKFICVHSQPTDSYDSVKASTLYLDGGSISIKETAWFNPLQTRGSSFSCYLKKIDNNHVFSVMNEIKTGVASTSGFFGLITISDDHPFLVQYSQTDNLSIPSMAHFDGNTYVLAQATSSTRPFRYINFAGSESYHVSTPGFPTLERVAKKPSCVVELRDKWVFDAYTKSDNGWPYLRIISVESGYQEVVTEVALNASTKYKWIPISLSSSSILFLYATGTTVGYTSIFISESGEVTQETPKSNGTTIKKAISNLHNVGVAGSNGKGGDTIKVHCAV